MVNVVKLAYGVAGFVILDGVIMPVMFGARVVMFPAPNSVLFEEGDWVEVTVVAVALVGDVGAIVSLELALEAIWK